MMPLCPIPRTLMACKPGKNGVAKAFSVLEVLVVVVLLSIVAVFSAPTWRGFFEVSLEKEAARLQSVLQLLRQEAVLNRQAYWLVLEIEKGGYRIESEDKEGKRQLRKTPHIMRPYRLSSALKVLRVLSGGPIKDNGEASLRVDSLGFADPFVWQLLTPKGKRSLQSSILAEVKVLEGHVDIIP